MAKVTGIVSHVREPGQRRAGSAARLSSGVLIAVGLIALMLFGAFALHTSWLIPNHDNEWLLIAAGRVLAGGSYVKDITESNPPLILLLYAPAVAVAQWLTIDTYNAFVAYICGLILISVVLAAPALSWCMNLRPACTRALLVCYVAVLCLDPGYSFGQREHLFIIMFCPGLFWFAARESGRPSPIDVASVAAILLACVAALIKPMFLLVPAVLLGLRIVNHRSWRVLADVPVVALIAVALLYAALVELAFPAYLTEMSIQRQVYFAWNRSWLTVLNASRDAVAALCLATVLTELAPISPRQRKFLRYLCAAAAACLIVALAQKKGWPYHLLPTVEIASIVLAFIVLALLPDPGSARSAWFHAAALAGIVVIELCFIWLRPLGEMRTFARQRFAAEPLIHTLRQIAAGRSVLLLTSGFQQGFPSMAAVQVAGRAPSRVLLPGTVRLASGDAAARGRSVSLERLVVHDLVEDLQRYKPEFVAVDRRASKQGLPDNFDMLGFYGRDRDFRQLWAAYRLTRTVPGWDIYMRAEAN